MKGSYHFRVKSKKTLFDFEIRRNITVIKGDSATGKTTLLHMLYEYLRVGKESGYSVSTNASYYVYLRQEVGRDWKDALLPLENTIIFIEENNDFVFTEAFAAFVKNSGNYFVVVNRSPLKMLPYSIHEIYEIVTDGKRLDVKESYHELRELYSNYPNVENNRFSDIVTEDSNSGHQFFEKVFPNHRVFSANGNGNIVNLIKNMQGRDTLAVADGAAYGAMIEEHLEYFDTVENRRLSMWLPESFEYLILKSGMVQEKELPDILKDPSAYVDSREFVSWERFFTQLLVSITANTEHRYSKQKLPAYYLQENQVKKILEQFPAEIRERRNKNEET
jgi:hypothetical protein